MPLTAYGDENVPLTFEMDNVSISFRKGSERIDFMHVCNYDLIMLKNLELKNYKGNALLKKWSDGNIIIDNLKFDLDKDNIEVAATEEFYAESI